MQLLTTRNLPGVGDEISWAPCTGHPLDPRTEEDPEWWFTQGDAEELAEEELLRTPRYITDWIWDECIEHCNQIHIHPDHAIDGCCDVPRLLVALLNGSDCQIIAAAYALRDKLREGEREWLERRARELFNERNGVLAVEIDWEEQ